MAWTLSQLPWQRGVLQLLRDRSPPLDGAPEPPSLTGVHFVRLWALPFLLAELSCASRAARDGDAPPPAVASALGSASQLSSAASARSPEASSAVASSAPSTSAVAVDDAGAGAPTGGLSTTASPSLSSADVSPPPSASTDPSGIRIEGNKILLNGAVFHIRGANWNPIPKGQVHPDGLAYAAMADIDIPLMQAAGINAVRTYERLEDRTVLDKLHAAGIYVFSTVLGWWQDDPSVVIERVNQVKDHPAILGWVIGNEWNYNHLYGNDNLSEEQTRDVLDEAARLIKSVDTAHPVTTIWGGTPPKSMIDAMPDIDIWGLNVYSGLSFGTVFSDYAARSSKPMYLGEYGADAYNATTQAYDPEAQALADQTLTEEILANLVTLPGGVASGGFVFEWSDEWWKDQAAGNLSDQDVGGIAPGGGPYPDATFNEEWWGIVDIERHPRPAYDALKALYAP